MTSKKVLLIALVTVTMITSCNNPKHDNKVSENTIKPKDEDGVTKDARTIANLECDGKRLLVELDSFTRKRDFVVDSFNRTPPEKISDDLRMEKKKWVDRINYQAAQIDGLKTFKDDTDKSMKVKYKTLQDWQIVQAKVDSLKAVLCK